jgi:hypothetical protein
MLQKAGRLAKEMDGSIHLPAAAMADQLVNIAIDTPSWACDGRRCIDEEAKKRKIARRRPNFVCERFLLIL